MRDWKELLQGSHYVVDLSQKILVFLDMPHDLLLQRLRSLLSHDDKTIILKITDRKEKGGLRTKTVVVEGYPTVIFCSAKFNMEEQEKTRLLLLSPEISQEKLSESIALKIEKEADREAFSKSLMENPDRKMLVERVRRVKEANIGHVIIPEELREVIYQQFVKGHKYFMPRHQRDVSRLLALIKAHSLLNFMHRKKVDDSIIVEREDVEAGFRLYHGISEANEMGLSPEVYNVYCKIEPHVNNEGITRNDFQKIYFNIFHKPLGQKRSQEILDILTSSGLLYEDFDASDKRKKRYFLAKKEISPGEIVLVSGQIQKSEENFLPHTEGEYISIPEVYGVLREQFSGPFLEEKALDVICRFRQCGFDEAEKLFQTWVDEGKVFRNTEGLWVWNK